MRKVFKGSSGSEPKNKGISISRNIWRSREEGKENGCKEDNENNDRRMNESEREGK